jgi:hypothetical protein
VKNAARKLAKRGLMQVRRARINALAAPRGLPWLRRRLWLPSNEVYDPLGVETTSDARTIGLDAAARFVRPLPHFAASHPAVNDFFATRTEDLTPPRYVSEFIDGLAWGHPTGGVFTQDRRFVPAFTHDPCGPAFHTVWTRVYLPTPKKLSGRTLYLVTPEATDNFHHWLIDLLPRLGLVRRAGYVLEEFDHVIVNHSARRFQLSTLAHLGIAPEKIITADASLLVQAELLVVPSLKSSNQTFPASDLGFLRHAMGIRVDPGTPRRRIFLSRGDAGYRRLQNEAAMHPMLRSLDFEIIRPGELDVPAQAKLFSESEVIAGPAGAAFANLVFAPPGAQVVELVPPQWLSAFHWMLSARAGLEHTIVLGDGEVMRGVPDSAARHLDLVIDPARLAVSLERTALGAKIS